MLALQRFLTDAGWDVERLIGRLQFYLGPRLQLPQAVWVLDVNDFPKQGQKSEGKARQYCGMPGKIANCQEGMFLAHMGPPPAQRRYRGKTDRAQEMLLLAQAGAI